MKRQRFAILNLALLLMFGAAPFLRGDRPFVKLLFAVLLTVILLSAVNAVGRRWHARMIVLPLAVLATIAQIIGLVRADLLTLVVHHALAIAVMLSVILLVIRRLFSVTTADHETINASLCVYLLMVILWAIAYSMTEALFPGSFSYSLAEAGPGVMRLGDENTVLALYYSFVTITTLGYGDIIPATPATKMLAAAQAVAGQVYLVILVARLVGLHVSRTSGDDA